MNNRKGLVTRSILLGGAAAALLSAAPAFAQTKPSEERTVCGGGNYELIEGGPATTWREPGTNEYGGTGYNPSSPVAKCGDAYRSTPLKCVDMVTHEAVAPALCNSQDGTSAATTWIQQNSSSNKLLVKNTSGPEILYSYTETTNLGTCDSDDGNYAWKSNPPSTAGVCGTQDVPVQVTCIDVDTNAVVSDAKCGAVAKPPVTKTVTSNEGCSYDYAVSAWSDPAPTCGQVQQTRTVTCQAPDGSPATEAQCAAYLTPTDAQAEDPKGMSTALFWSKGAYPWPEVGSPSPSGNNIFIYRMPVACDKGVPADVQAECTYRVRLTAKGYQQTYIRPKDSRTVNDTRTCDTTPAEQYDGYHWNDPTYVATESKCGDNTKTGRVFCIKDSDSSEVDEALCDPAKKPLASISFQDESACEPATPTPTPTDTPTPEIIPVTPAPVTPVEIQVGYCGKTSSGGGRFACGEYANYRPGPVATPPQGLCSGSVIADGMADGVHQTPRAGAGWTTPPRLDVVDGARCVIHYRYGYSDNGSTAGWVSLYYNGAPTGAPGGLWVGPKP